MVARDLSGTAATAVDALSGNVLRLGGTVIGPAPRPHERTYGARLAMVADAKASMVRRVRRFTAKAATAGGARGAVTISNPPPGGIDLTVTNLVAVPAAPTGGDPVVFTVTVRNAGVSAVPAGRAAGENIGIGIYLDGASTPVTWINYDGGLAPGAAFTLNTTSGWAPGGVWTAVEGPHTIRAWVDDANLIAETNETNNTLDLVFTVAHSEYVPPLGGARLFADTSPWNTVKNAGQFSYQAYADGFLASQDYGINNGPGYYVPCYFGSENDPVQTFNVGQGWVDDRPKVFIGQAPEGMVSPAGGDGNMDIVFADGTLLDCYQARYQGNHVWNVAMAVDTNAYTGFGFAQPDKGNNRATGTTVAGCPQAAGGILRQDILAGTIAHGLRIAFNYSAMDAPQVGYALYNDVGGGGGPFREGALLMPNGPEPGGLSSWGHQLWVAMVTYGVWITDKLDGPPLIFGDGSDEVIGAFGSYYSAEITACCRKLRMTTVGFSWPMPW